MSIGHSPDAPAPPGSPVDPWSVAAARRFMFDVLHVRQKIIAIAQKYHVTDPDGTPRFYVVRPPKLAINMGLGCLASLIRLAVFAGLLYYVTAGFQTLVPARIPVLIVASAVVGILSGIALRLASPYRHIEVFADESQSWRLMTITQDNKIGFWLRFTLYDWEGQEVAQLRRNALKAFLRREWAIDQAEGQQVIVREDSWVRSLLRRYLGPLYGALRTNFNFELPDGSQVGTYDRQFTIRDMYVLDLRADPEHVVDRRVALAMSILLDSAEGR